MLLRNAILNLLFISLIGGLPEAVLAAGQLPQASEYNTQSIIDGGTVQSDQGNNGVVTTNEASGQQNTQANNGALAVNQQDGSAKVNTGLQQTIDASQLTSPASAKAQIIGNSFNNTAGWTAINQASGQANAQANSFTFSEGSQATINTGVAQKITGDFKTEAFTPIGFGKTDKELGISGELLADNALQKTLSGEQSPVVGGPVRAQRAISVDDTAFKGARGLVQLNQTAGSGNSSVNNFALRITVGANL
jgi:hypothetical protein